jgi:hypothetical protein
MAKKGEEILPKSTDGNESVLKVQIPSGVLDSFALQKHEDRCS